MFHQLTKLKWSYFTLFLLVLASCVEEPKPKSENPPAAFSGELSSAKIALVVEKASERASVLKMKSISPNTGTAPKYSYKVNEISYDAKTQQATVALTVSWRAKLTELSSKRDWCEISGSLSLNFTNRNAGIVSATFIPKSCNDWAKQCASHYYGESEEFVLKPITFDPYK